MDRPRICFPQIQAMTVADIIYNPPPYPLPKGRGNSVVVPAILPLPVGRGEDAAGSEVRVEKH